jgi:acyl-CoA thioester hydrolase
MGIVYHARYFEWFEAARTELMRSMGIAYRQLEEEGVFMPVVEAHCRYRLPVKYDECIRIKTTIGEVTRAKVRLDYKICGENDDLARGEGYTVHCFVGKDGKPRRAPEDVLVFFQNNVE